MFNESNIYVLLYFNLTFLFLYLQTFKIAHKMLKYGPYLFSILCTVILKLYHF